MKTWLMLLLFAVISYIGGMRLFDYMDGTKRVEWNVPAFESTLEQFNSQKYNLMNNLTALEMHQNRLKQAHDVITSEDLNTDMMDYVQAVNASVKAMNESVQLMQFVCDECESLIGTALEFQIREKEEQPRSEYQPVQLAWNLYYLYANAALDEQCKVFHQMLQSLILSVRRVLHETRTFVEHRKFKELTAQMSSEDVIILQQIENTQTFVHEPLFFESERDHLAYTQTASRKTSNVETETECVEKQYVQLLKMWGLETFVDVFEKHGWDDTVDWKQLSDADLITMGFAKGHILKFRRLYEEWLSGSGSDSTL